MASMSELEGRVLWVLDPNCGHSIPNGAKETNMAKVTHVTAPTRFVEINGIRYAYRRFGSESGTPLVFLQHFRGGLDKWDPLVTDGRAQGRPVILFNNAGVASSSGETPQHHRCDGRSRRCICQCPGIASGRCTRFLHRRLRCAELRAYPSPSRKAPRSRRDR